VEDLVTYESDIDAAKEHMVASARIVEEVWRRFQADPRIEIAYPHMELVRYEPKHEEPPGGGPPGPRGGGAGKRPGAKPLSTDLDVVGPSGPDA
jgi:hypothetical protein